MIDIKGLDKAQLLVELYNHSHQQGMGMLQPSRSLTLEDAKKILEQTTSFDYLYGKVMKVDLSGDEFEERLYDRDIGQGAAQKIVDNMRKELEQQQQIDPITKFVVGSEEYNAYYSPRDKRDLYLDPKTIEKRDYTKPSNNDDVFSKLKEEVSGLRSSNNLTLNNSILVDEEKTLNLVRQAISKRGISRLFAEVPESFDDIDEITFKNMQEIDFAHLHSFISRDDAIEMIADLFERQGFCRKFDKYVDDVLMTKLRELFEVLEFKYQDLLNALNTGKISQAQFEEKMRKLREFEANSMQQIISQNETLKGQSK